MLEHTWLYMSSGPGSLLRESHTSFRTHFTALLARARTSVLVWLRAASSRFHREVCPLSMNAAQICEWRRVDWRIRTLRAALIRVSWLLASACNSERTIPNTLSAASWRRVASTGRRAVAVARPTRAQDTAGLLILLGLLSIPVETLCSQRAVSSTMLGRQASSRGPWASSKAHKVSSTLLFRVSGMLRCVSTLSLSSMARSSTFLGHSDSISGKGCQDSISCSMWRAAIRGLAGFELFPKQAWPVTHSPSA
mmetsp:Transcript_22271/g.61782  ORF Transcript_22271/g.61782 Transcript_22271/m.61782 type:complete len:252 (-) Transcript_22271:6-761(-)